MSGRIAHAVGLTAAIVLAACYDVPQPECGFVCGPPAFEGGDGTCPDGYICIADDNRCHRSSPPFTDLCPGDAGPLPDLRPPQLVMVVPEADTVDFPLSSTIEVHFDEAVDHITEFGSITVINDTFGTMVDTSDQVSSISGDGRAWQIGITNGQFTPDTHFTVHLSSMITDFAQNAISPFSWGFKTAADTTAPTAMVEAPPQFNASIFSSVFVTFSEPVINVNDVTFRVTGPTGAVDGSLSMQPPTSVQFSPFGDFKNSTQYTVSLSSAITDLAGNPLIFTPVTFTTEADTTPPVVTFPSPGNNQTGISVLPTINVGFSEVVTGVTTASYFLNQGATLVPTTLVASTQSAIITPRRQLAANTAYRYMLTSAITDTAGNALVPTTINFTTGNDFFSPRILARSPASSATGVAVDTIVTVDFDEPVVNLTTTTFQLLDAGTPIAAAVTYDSGLDRATLTPSLPLAANKQYVVLFQSPAQDAAGNGVNTSWPFTTGADTVVPHILSTLPADDATAVDASSTISVTFDEPVTNIDDTSFVVMNGGTGTLASSNGGRTWTFTPDVPLAAATTVTILLTSAIEDAAGNALATPFTFDFTTAP